MGGSGTADRSRPPEWLPAVVAGGLFVALFAYVGLFWSTPTEPAVRAGDPGVAAVPDPLDTTVAGPENAARPPDAAGNTVRYAALTERQRAAFRAAIDGTAAFAPLDAAEYDLESLAPFRRTEYVRYEGRYYAVTLTTGYAVTTYAYDLTRASPGEDATVLSLGDLPAGERRRVRRALDGPGEGGRYESTETPSGFDSGDYLRVGNRTYRVGPARPGETRLQVLTVSVYGSVDGGGDRGEK